MADILQQVDQRIVQYKTDHRGDKPLYIIVSPHEADDLLSAIRKKEGFDEETLLTEYNGSKIVKHDMLKKGDLLLSNELPETGS